MYMFNHYFYYLGMAKKILLIMTMIAVFYLGMIAGSNFTALKTIAIVRSVMLTNTRLIDELEQCSIEGDRIDEICRAIRRKDTRSHGTKMYKVSTDLGHIRKN